MTGTTSIFEFEFEFQFALNLTEQSWNGRAVSTRLELGPMGIEALCAAPPEAPSLQVGPVAAVGVGHLRIVRHLLV